MHERGTNIERWRAGKPIYVDNVALLPIERVVMHSDIAIRHAWFTVAKKPYAIVVRDANGTRIIGIDATAPTQEQLREKIPGLDDLLAHM